MRKMKGIIVLLAVLTMCVSSAYAGTTTCGTAIRTLQNPYQANYKVGADLFAKQNGLKSVILTCEGSSEKQLNDIKALVGSTGGDLVVVVDPNEAPNVIPIARELDMADVYWVSWWNKPEDIKVWDYKNWVCHLSYDGISAGEFTAEELCKKIGGKGKIIALQGMLANSTAQDRFKGLQNILKKYPDVKLVAVEAADWDRTIAYEKTKNMLVANPDIAGVWAANDNMGLGALEALRSEGKAGKVLVTGIDGAPEMITAVKKGESACTVYNDSKYQAGIGLAIALAAKEGKIDVSKLPKEHRQFYMSAINVNQENVDEIIKTYIDSTPNYDFNDFFGGFVRAME